LSDSRLRRTEPRDPLTDDEFEVFLQEFRDECDRYEAEEQRALIVGAERLWQQHGRISITLLQRELSISYARAKKLHRATMPPATVQLAMSFPEPPAKPPKPAKRQKRAVRRGRRPQIQYNNVSGYIYVIRDDESHYKIGLSTNPAARLRQLNGGSPYPLAFEILEPCKDIYRVEAKLHEQFANRRLKGEWFALTESDLEEIRHALK
jgi:hypothetical protein